MQHYSGYSDDETIVMDIRKRPNEEGTSDICSSDREFPWRSAGRPADVTDTNSDLHSVDGQTITKDPFLWKNSKFRNDIENEQRDTTIMIDEEQQQQQQEPSSCGADLSSMPSSSQAGTEAEQKPQHHLTRRPRLTLSAFRKPAERLLDCDQSRLLTHEYELSSIIGHGATSTVRVAKRKSDGTKVAIKYIAKHDMLRSRVRGSHVPEWELLKMLKANPFIVDLLDIFETDEEIQLVMEYCTGGELYHYIEQQDSLGSESQAARVAFQMLTALGDLHSHNIVHRDVKPENILLASGNQFKLCDFGLARFLSNGSDGDASPMSPHLRSRAYSTVGSDFYTAPEVSSRDGYGTPVDIYSLGVTLYVLLCGFSPLESKNLFPGFAWSSVSQDAKAFLRKMLDPSPTSRVSAAEALQDPWIQRFAGKRKTGLELSSPSKPRPVVDLELVRKKLFVEEGNPSKRRRLVNEMEQFISEVADFATAAASGVNVYGDDSVEVLEEENDDDDEEDVQDFHFRRPSTATLCTMRY